MSKHKKKKKKTMRMFPLLILVIIGSIGWYFTKTLQGIIFAIVSYFFFYNGFKIWWKIRRLTLLKKAGIRKIDKMSGEEFEHFLGLLFKKRGFKVSYTSTTGDYGADLILRDREDIIAVQAKRYSGSVGVKAVQEIIGAKKMYDATEAWVVTNSHFTKNAERLAEANEVYLIDREQLIDIISNKR